MNSIFSILVMDVGKSKDRQTRAVRPHTTETRIREICWLACFFCFVSLWCLREGCTFPFTAARYGCQTLTDGRKPVGRRSSIMSLLLQERAPRIPEHKNIESTVWRNRTRIPCAKLTKEILNESRHPRESCRGASTGSTTPRCWTSKTEYRHLLNRGEIDPICLAGLLVILANRQGRSSTCRKNLAQKSAHSTNESGRCPDVSSVVGRKPRRAFYLRESRRTVSSDTACERRGAAN